METCEMCGADLEGGSGCARCFAVYKHMLGVLPGDAEPFREWLEDVITTRVRAFADAGHLSEVANARIEEAIDKHENRYYHNRRPEY